MKVGGAPGVGLVSSGYRKLGVRSFLSRAIFIVAPIFKHVRSVVRQKTHFDQVLTSSELARIARTKAICQREQH